MTQAFDQDQELETVTASGIKSKVASFYHTLSTLQADLDASQRHVTEIQKHVIEMQKDLKSHNRELGKALKDIENWGTMLGVDFTISNS